MIVVVGSCNVSVTLPVGSFPVAYEPARYLPGQIALAPSGVALNVATVLAEDGAVELMVPLAADAAAALVLAHCESTGIDLSPCADIATMPCSVVMVDDRGERMVNTDLGEALRVQVAPGTVERCLAKGPRGVVLGNLPWASALIRAFRAADVPVLVDLQDLQGSGNPYDQPFLEATYLSASHERIKQRDLAHLAHEVLMRSDARAFFLTLGADGVLVATRDAAPVLVPQTNRVQGVNTTGAGDMFTAVLARELFEHGLAPLRAAQIGVDEVARRLALR